MSTHLNAALATGRDILAIERELSTRPAGDPDRARLGAEHTALMRRQQEQLVAAHRAGVDWDTIRAALEWHGQHAGRQVGDTAPTPAARLLALITACGAEPVVAALDAARDSGQ